jgi:hypothetical protein
MYKYLFPLLFFCTCFTACIKDGETYEFRRTVVVYLGRDDRALSASNEDKITSLLKGWNGKKGNLVIYQDTAQYDSAHNRIKGNASLMNVIPGRKGVNTIETIAEYGDENSADPAVFNRVLQDAIRLYPADAYGLVVFSHGSGWLPEGTLAAPRSVIKDQERELNLLDLSRAIPAGTFDFIVFEACLTAGIEVVYELKDKTPYIFASSAEILSPGFRDVYTTSINYLFEREPRLTSFAENTFNSISTSEAHFYSATFSLIKTSGLDDLAAFLRTHIDREKTVDVSDIQRFGRYPFHLLFHDFEDYFSRILKDGASGEELASLIEKCVVYRRATPAFLLAWDGFEVIRHSGLTVYIEQERYPFLNSEYRNLSWYQAVFE